MPFEHKRKQREREIALAKLQDATEENETSEVIAKAVEGGVRGAMASIREGDDDNSTPPPKKSHKRLIALLVTLLSALGAALTQVLGK